jgi:hypothetical protein
MPGLHTPVASAGATDAAVGHHDQDHDAVAATHAELKGKREAASGSHVPRSIRAAQHEHDHDARRELT